MPPLFLQPRAARLWVRLVRCDSSHLVVETARTCEGQSEMLMGKWVSKPILLDSAMHVFPPVDPPGSQGPCSAVVIAKMMPTLPSYDSDVVADVSPPATVWMPLEGEPSSWRCGWTDTAPGPGGGTGEMSAEEQKGRKSG